MVAAHQLAARMRTIPGQFEAATLVLVVGAALFWAVVASVFSNLHSAVRAVGRHTVPSIVAAEKMNVALADINTNFANAMLAKDDDSKPSWRMIKEQSDAVSHAVSHALITASENVTYGTEEEGPIYAIQSNLPVYFRLLGQARSKMQSDARGYTSRTSVEAMWDVTIRHKDRKSVQWQTVRLSGHSSCADSYKMCCQGLAILDCGIQPGVSTLQFRCGAPLAAVLAARLRYRMK
jgi:hypothetical protein